MQQKVTYIGPNIRYLREKDDLTQEQLCGCLKRVSTKSLSRYETDDLLPPMKVLLQIAEYFNCSLDELVYEDLSNQNATDKWENRRKPKVTGSDFAFFEGQKYYIYYLSEKSDGKFKSGELILDKKHDEERLFLHGLLKMHHEYDCKLVIDGRNAIVYATGKEVHQRAVIVMHFPDFGKGKNFKYRGGIGIVTHRDTHKNQSTQRICLTPEIITDEIGKQRIMEALLGDEGTERIIITLKMDSAFSQWILNRDKN